MISEEEVVEPKTILRTGETLSTTANSKRCVMQTGNLNVNGRFKVPRKEKRTLIQETIDENLEGIKETGLLGLRILIKSSYLGDKQEVHFLMSRKLLQNESNLKKLSREEQENK